VNRCRSEMLLRHRREQRVVADDSAVNAAVALRDADLFLRDSIERALASLDADQREAFLLKHVEQLDYEEMAAVTRASVSALKMRVSRACSRLQKLLEEDRYA
jgi:RNA polymerase sigma-70 factor, ECF subfamily